MPNLAVGFDGGYFKQGDKKLISDAYNKLLSDIRPQAVNLVELMRIPDEVLVSSIGNSYGDIYETHFEWSRTSRLNDEKNDSILPGFKETFWPILKGKL